MQSLFFHTVFLENIEILIALLREATFQINAKVIMTRNEINMQSSEALAINSMK